jgi:secretion/DNA translocation related TadE-like protein
VNDDAGSATVLVVGAGALLSVLAVAVGVVATGLAAHRQVVRAADLAALAGAQRSLTDVDEACHTAGVVAVANGSVLDDCRLDGRALQVTVTMPATGWLPVMAATSKAGLAVS